MRCSARDAAASCVSSRYWTHAAGRHCAACESHHAATCAADGCGHVAPRGPRRVACLPFQRGEHGVGDDPGIVPAPRPRTPVRLDCRAFSAVQPRSTIESLNAERPRYRKPARRRARPRNCADLRGVPRGAGHAVQVEIQGMKGESGQGAVGRGVGSRVVDGEELDQVQSRLPAPLPSGTRSANSPTPQPAAVRRAATGTEMPVKWRSSGAKRICSPRVEDGEAPVKYARAGSAPAASGCRGSRRTRPRGRS